MSQPESRLSKTFIEYLRSKGAWVFKVHGSEFQPSGIPDILGSYHGQFIGVESKMPGNSLSEIQVFRIRRIRDAGGMVCVAYSKTDVQQLILHLDTHHLIHPPKCTAETCRLYGKEAD